MEMLVGRKILVLEDELLIAAALDDILSDLGCLTHSVRRVQHAIALVDELQFDAALLDMNLDGELSLPVAHALAARHTPFAWMSGYKSTEVAELFGEAPILRKPFSETDVVRILTALCGQSAPMAKPIGSTSDKPRESKV
jgi:CheY-like chemotaxis protein